MSASPAERLAQAREVLERATRDAQGTSPQASQRSPRRGRGRAPEPSMGGADNVESDADQESVARAIALRQLNTSPRSRAQLEQAMARKDVPDAVAERVLDRFEEVGLVDDAAYAGMLVRTRAAERGLARRAIAVELRRKGIDEQTAQQALGEVDADDELDSARRLVEKRLRSMSGLPDDVKRRRLVAMLGRKGHPPGLGLRVVDEALRGES